MTDPEKDNQNYVEDKDIEGASSNFYLSLDEGDTMHSPPLNALKKSGTRDSGYGTDMTTPNTPGGRQAQFTVGSANSSPTIQDDLVFQFEEDMHLEDPTVFEGHHDDTDGDLFDSSSTLTLSNTKAMDIPRSPNSAMDIPISPNSAIRGGYNNNVRPTLTQRHTHFTPPRGYQMPHRFSTGSMPDTFKLHDVPSKDKAADMVRHGDQFIQGTIRHAQDNLYNRGRPRVYSECNYEDAADELPQMRGRANSAPAIITLEKHFGQELRRISDEFHRDYHSFGELYRDNQRHHEVHHSSSFPGSSGQDTSWWQSVVQFFSPPRTRPHVSRTVRPFRDSIAEVDEEDLTSSDVDRQSSSEVDRQSSSEADRQSSEEAQH